MFEPQTSGSTAAMPDVCRCAVGDCAVSISSVCFHGRTSLGLLRADVQMCAKGGVGCKMGGKIRTGDSGGVACLWCNNTGMLTRMQQQTARAAGIAVAVKACTHKDNPKFIQFEVVFFSASRCVCGGGVVSQDVSQRCGTYLSGFLSSGGTRHNTRCSTSFPCAKLCWSACTAAMCWRKYMTHIRVFNLSAKTEC